MIIILRIPRISSNFFIFLRISPNSLILFDLKILRQRKMSKILNIRELDPDIIKPSMKDVNNPGYKGGGSKIVVIGKPGSGKSRLIQSLIYEKRACFPVGLVMSGTEESNHHFGSKRINGKRVDGIFPDTFVHPELDLRILEKFVKRQKIAKEYLPNPFALILLDDCMDDPKIFNDKLFHKIYKNGRVWDFLMITAMQYCMDVKPVIRTSIDGAFIFREPNIKVRKALYENYASIIPSFKLFCSIMDAMTEDYTALYVHNRVQSNNVEDCVFWYKAKPVPETFKFGCEDYWNFHFERYNEKYSNLA